MEFGRTVKILKVLLLVLQFLDFLCSVHSRHQSQSKRKVDKVVHISPYVTEYEHQIFLERHQDYSAQLKMDNEKSVGLSREYKVSIIPGKADITSFGIVAVVQMLNMRPNKIETENITLENNVSLCRDFIEFISPEGEQNSSGKICGFLRTKDRGFNNSELIGERAFYSEYPSLEIRIHVDNSTFGRKDKKNSFSTKAEIVFTAYIKDCRSENLFDWKPCSVATSNYSCIPSNLVCNGKIECGFEKEFAYDESNCYYCTPCAIVVISAFPVIAVIIGIVKRKIRMRNYPKILVGPIR